MEEEINELDLGNAFAPDNFIIDNAPEIVNNEDNGDSEEHPQNNAIEESLPNEQSQNENSSADEQPNDAPEQQKDTDYYEITVSDGTTKKVTIDDLKQGYLLQSDYTKKTAELARQRETVETELKANYKQLETQVLEAANALISKYNPITQLHAHREAIIKQAQEAYEIGDNEGLLAKRLDLMELDKQIAATEQEVGALLQASQYQTQQMTTQKLEQERAKLFQAIPELANPEKAKEFQEATYTALQKAGYTEQEMQDMSTNVDARQAHIAYLAGLYLKMQNSAPQAAKAIQDKIVTPKTSSNRQTGNGSNLLDRLKQNPNDEYAIGALFAPV